MTTATKPRTTPVQVRQLLLYMFVLGASVTMNVVALALLWPNGDTVDKAACVATETTDAAARVSTDVASNDAGRPVPSPAMSGTIVRIQPSESEETETPIARLAEVSVLEARIAQLEAQAADLHVMIEELNDAHRQALAQFANGEATADGADDVGDTATAPPVVNGGDIVATPDESSSAPLPNPGTLALSDSVSVEWNGAEGFLYVTVPKSKIRYGTGAFELFERYFVPWTVPDGAFGRSLAADDANSLRILFLDGLSSHPKNADLLAEVLSEQQDDGTLAVDAWKHMQHGDITVPIAYVDGPRLQELLAQYHGSETLQYSSTSHTHSA